MGCASSSSAGDRRTPPRTRRLSSASSASTPSPVPYNPTPPPPREPTPPPREPTPPPREPTPPPREPTPPPREPTPPPREPTPSSREPTPPPREPTLPLGEPFPPPREPSPPPREPTPSSREPTPPPREPTPPPREPFPPPREPSPPLGEPFPPPHEPSPTPREPSPPLGEPFPPPHEPSPAPCEPTPPLGEPFPPPHEPSPPPREPTPPLGEPFPPPHEPSPPPRESSPPPREPTPPPREPTPEARDPTPEPLRPRNEEVGGYKCSDIGIYEQSTDLRERPTPLDKAYSQYPSDLPYTDSDFELHDAIRGETNLEWKRPGEFVERPVLFSDGTTRFDIGQGSAGTCWFLSMVANLADRPELFHRIIPKDAWNQDHGTFCCYFWRFGEWELVVIDDRLPVIYGDVLWGAKSKDDPNEIWPALVEKAFAKFHGCYNNIYGGQSADSYLALTGGCAEYLDFDKELEADADGDTMTKARAIHSRIKNACQSDAMLATEVPGQYDNHLGLVGGHAYSLTGATTVTRDDGRTVHLVRVRNPWGKTEWQGRWRDGGSEWSTIRNNVVKHANIDDGEFWIELKDFIKFFTGVTICSLVPDFDKDGCKDELKFCTDVCGDWIGEKAAGFQNRINNPRYLFYVSDDGMDEEGLVPIVVQLCQKVEHRKTDKTSIRSDLYKIIGLNDEGGHEPTAVAELLGDVTNLYKVELSYSGRYSVEPGHYMVVPSTMDSGLEKEFLLRIFSPSPLQDIRELDRRYAMMQSKQFKAPDGHLGRSHQCVCEFGRWVPGRNAGGQVSRQTFYKNPTIEFEVPDRGQPQMVNLTLMQKAGPEQFPIGIRVFAVNDGYEIQEGDEGFQRYLYDNYDACPETVDGGKGAFIVGSEASVTHMLPGGRYFAILHMDDESQSTSFSLLMRSSSSLNTRMVNWA